ISAFRATLEEVRAADVIVHLRDVSHADSEAQARDVEAILDEIGVADRADRQGTAEAAPLAISAATGEGIDRLLAAIEDRLARGRPEMELTLDASDGQ